MNVTNTEPFPRKAILTLLLDAPVGADPHSPSSALEAAIDAAFGEGTSATLMFSMPFSDPIAGTDHDVPPGYVAREGSALAAVVRRLASEAALLPEGAQSAEADALYLPDAAFDELLRALVGAKRPRFVFFDARRGEPRYLRSSELIAEQFTGFVCIEAVAEDG